jgi:hypothetical protein
MHPWCSLTRSLVRRLALPLVTLALALGSGTICQAVTPPVDWHLVVNVRPLVPGAHPTTEDRVRVLLYGSSTPQGVGLTTFDASVSGITIRLQGHRGGVDGNPLPHAWQHDIELPRLPLLPGCCELEVYDEELLIHSQPLEVFTPLHGLGFWIVDPHPVNIVHLAATARLTDPLLGAARDASAVQSTPSSGYFWFFDPDNVEVTVKILDGRPVNGHFWIFLTGMTNLGLSVTVAQTAPCPGGVVCPSKTYVNPPGQRFNVIDTTSF